MVTTLVVAAGLAGCGGEDFPSYPNSKACGVSAKRVQAVVGTDHYKTQTKGDALPPTSSPLFSCSVNLADHPNVLIVTARLRSFDKVATAKKQIAASDEKFTVGAGHAGIEVIGDAFTALWVCETLDKSGTMTASVDGGHVGASAAERRALVTAVAEKAGAGCEG
ncbi:MAG: hypothetical protein ABIR34_04565 [Marmoricola sp.]